MWEKINNWFKKLLANDTGFGENKLVYKTTQMYLANIMKLKLEEESIQVYIINKRDSSYNDFGQIELYVHQDDVLRAKYIIEKEYE